MAEKRTINCPLCCSTNTAEFSHDNRRDYYECAVCRLVFVPSSQFLSPQDEKRRYDLHRNSPEDEGYRNFLGRLFIAINERAHPGSAGLDFGSGPAPSALARMFEQAGHSMAVFDHFYAPFPDSLEREYDFIAASEVVEHLRDPKQELDRLWARLRPGGVLGIMTQFAPGRADFSGWHYKNDRTHICFFSRPTFEWIAGFLKADLVFAGKSVVLLEKTTKKAGERILSPATVGKSRNSDFG